jgi:hypothetical protein
MNSPVLTSCGHPAPPDDPSAPFRPCRQPRCRSRLPPHFSQEECVLFLHLKNRGRGGWLLDTVSKKVFYGKNEYENLVDFVVNAELPPEKWEEEF